MRILLTGATGTIGRAVAQRLLTHGHQVLCTTRAGAEPAHPALKAVQCDLTREGSLTAALKGASIDAVISCMASRSGAPKDAWAVEHDAQSNLLKEAQAAGAGQFILLSAICVQRPKLAFQHAKRAFEEELQRADLNWSIVRPTAFFKSLSGQVARVQAGKPFLVFGDGLQTACKPISDRDLAAFIVACLTDADKQRRILPIGGPGPAITPMDQARRLEQMLGHPVKVKHVPFALMDVIAGSLGVLGLASQSMADKAEFARTGRYYATESMLVWDAERGRYDADATPEYGTDTLWDHYAALLSGAETTDLGAHAIF